MTFIVVPHGGGDLSTRSFEVSYRRLRVAAVVAGVAFLLWVGMALSWFWVAAQASRVPVLQREVADLQRERQRVEQLARTLARMEARYEQVRAMLGNGVRTDTSGVRQGGDEEGARGDSAKAEKSDDDQALLPGTWPLERPGYVTQGLRGRAAGHPGIDIAVTSGTRVRASGGGTVLAAGEDPVYGRFVRIRHAGGYESTYGHVSRVLVAASEPVRRAQVIALSGNTGVSTAPHLHFEIRKDGRPVDPRLLLRNPRQP